MRGAQLLCFRVVWCTSSPCGPDQFVRRCPARHASLAVVMPLAFVWAAARHPLRQPWQQKALFSKEARRDLAGCSEAGCANGLRDLSPESSPKTWADALAPTCGQLCGLLLVRPLWVADSLTYLGRAEREQWDFFTIVAAPGAEEHIVFLEAVAACSFAQPIHIGVENLAVKQNGYWSNLTPWTLQRCLEGGTTSGKPMSQVVAEWAARWNLDAGAAADRAPTLSVHVPAPHLILILGRAWKTLAIQYARGRRGRGLRCALARPLLGGDIDVPHDGLQQQPGPGQGEFFDVSLSPELLQGIADTMRLHVQYRQQQQQQQQVVDIPEHVLQQSLSHIFWLQTTRDNLVKQQLLQTKRCYHMMFLLECLAFSGFCGRASLFVTRWSPVSRSQFGTRGWLITLPNKSETPARFQPDPPSTGIECHCMSV